MRSIKETTLIIFSSIFFVLVDNYTFFKNVTEVYPTDNNLAFVVSLGVVLASVTAIVITLFSSRFTTKPLIILLLLISSMTNYYMNTYNVVIDDSMIRNALQTNIDESLDLLTFKMVVYFVLLGLIPSIVVYRLKVEYGGFKYELYKRFKLIGMSLLIAGVVIFAFSKYYTSFFREHKPLRYSTNPTYWIYSIGNYIAKTYNSGPIVVKKLGEDANISRDISDRKIVIMVVGEASRADHFSLNGYSRDTNPLLEKRDDIVNFSNFYSCGTSTAESVPCMFSKFNRSDYSYKKGITNENVVDVIKHTNRVAILWRDNNSDSKGVALRVKYADYKTAKNNPVCDVECRDEGMLVGLNKFIDNHKDKDILIVLHQMGNHGPAYYKRYQKRFEKYKPVCKTNQLEKCTQDEIINAYDNGIVHTDSFLNDVIGFLQKYQDDKTAMIYMSDHGESLGENGVYLHGLPYFMAPDAQTHIGSLMWFNDKMAQEIDINKLKKDKNKRYSQDNLFDTLLGIFDVKTKVYNKKMDILHDD